MFSYAIQKVGFDFDEVEQQGEIDLPGFMNAINTFAWRAQLQQWDEDQDGPLPTLVLQCEPEQRQLWISALGKELGDDFQLQSVSCQMRKSLFGKPKQERNVAIFNVHERSTLKQLCALFFQREFEALDHEAQRLALLDDED